MITIRQAQIMLMIANGETAKGIGKKLNIRESTVKNHLSTIRDKLKAINTAHAVFKLYGGKNDNLGDCILSRTFGRYTIRLFRLPKE